MKEARLVPEDVPADLCTHIFYAFANIGGLALQAQNPNDLNVYQGEQVEREREMKEGQCPCSSLAVVSTTDEAEREES